MEGRSGDSFWAGAVLTCNRAGVWEFKQLDGIGTTAIDSPAGIPELRTAAPQGLGGLPAEHGEPRTAPFDRGPAVWDDMPLRAGSDGPIPALEAEPLDGLIIGLGVGCSPPMADGQPPTAAPAPAPAPGEGAEDGWTWLEAV